MRILLIDVNCKHSSTGKIVYSLYENLKKQGHEVSICYGRGEKIVEDGIYKFGVDLETYIHAGLSRVTGYNGCYSPISTRRLLAFIKQFKPDIIHIHELHAYFVNIKPLVRFIHNNKIPLIWTFHCEYMYTGKCGYAYDCEKWKEECGNCPAVHDYPVSLFFDKTQYMFLTKKRLLLDLDFHIVTPSKWLAERIHESFLSDKPVSVIHNGIATKTIFYPRSTTDTSELKKRYGLNKKKIVLSVAPQIMDERKGGKTVLEIAKKLPEYDFVLVGADDSKRYTENVLLIERTKDQNELAEWYSLADIFLICSKKENFPTTCIEALACGTPIAGVDEGGTSETAVFPFGTFVKNDVDELVEAIHIQLSRSISQQEITRMANEKYSEMVMCREYLNLYTRVVKKEL